MNDDIFIASVYSVNASGAALILPGMTTATQKLYQMLSGVSVAAGDRVLCMRVSGTIIITGKL